MFFRIKTFIKKTYRVLRSIYGSLVNGLPLHGVKVIGVTGTSGKSTTSTMIYHLLKSHGLRVGLISTVQAKIGDVEIDTGFHVTTPDPIDLQRIAKRMRKEGMDYLVLETSSHALHQGRVGMIKFEVSVFTNIQRDHLDYHKTWEDYAFSKARLILKTRDDGYIVVNQDDLSYDFLLVFCKRYNIKSKVVEYSESKELTKLDLSHFFPSFEYKGELFKLSIFGDYNIQNALAAIKVGEIFGIDLSKIRGYLENFTTLPGRMEILQKEPFSVIVDFAHNTDSLKKALLSLRRYARANGSKIIAIFGSAGLRDIEKRFDMGKVSGELVDITIVTAEDPRTESLADINSEILRGCESGGAKLIKRFLSSDDYKLNSSKFSDGTNSKIVFSFDEESVNSRYDAIEFGISLARAGDIVVTFGKGHEQSLCFGKTEYLFSDHQAVDRALNKLNLQNDKK